MNRRSWLALLMENAGTPLIRRVWKLPASAR